MQLIPAIPREPVQRLRLLSLWFAVFATSGTIVDLGFVSRQPSTERAAGLVACALIIGWFIWGHRRRAFPEFTTPIEAVMLVAIGTSSTLPLRAMGVFFACSMLRSLYVTRREYWLLPISYGAARALSIALSPERGPYDVLSLTLAMQIAGLVIITGTFFLLVLALDRQAQLEAQLVQAQKMEAVAQLAGGVAHDFNNLLTVIVGHVFMLEDARALNPTVARNLDGITHAAERAAGLTRQLLAFGRKQLLKPTVLNLNAVINEAERLIRPAIGERVHIVTNLDPLLAPVRADAGQLEQVLLNLAINARDAMPAGGTLTIATSNVALATGPHVKLTVADTGSGMNSEVVSHLFEPFFTTKPQGKGTGLGLATVYGIIKQSFGEISVETAADKGSTFTIVLPIAKQAPVEARPHPTDFRPADVVARVTGPERVVLLVEDDDGVRAFAHEVLTRAGFRVLAARHGLEGLAIAEANDRAIDVVVTDVVMPEMGGRQMVEHLRRLRPELRVLYISGYADDASARRELAAGEEALLEKPFTARRLREAVLSAANN